MIKIPLTVCLFTSSKGHFSVKTRWRDTVASFDRALPLSEYEHRIAHIKRSPGDDVFEMSAELTAAGFEVIISDGRWVHGGQTHQSGYLEDCLTVYSRVKTPYVLHLEDDWSLCVSDGEFADWVRRALHLMRDDADLMQVRLARWANEFDRINGLKAKHNLPWRAQEADQWHFRHSDFSMNPSFMATRNIRAAVLLALKGSETPHVEHSTGNVLRAFSNVELPFACFDPAKIHVCHRGTLLGEEDHPTNPLYPQ